MSHLKHVPQVRHGSWWVEFPCSNAIEVLFLAMTALQFYFVHMSLYFVNACRASTDGVRGYYKTWTLNTGTSFRLGSGLIICFKTRFQTLSRWLMQS